MGISDSEGFAGAQADPSSKLDLRQVRNVSAWDPALEPRNWGSFDIEPFDCWARRNHEALLHIHPEICEQWLYRHWLQSPMCFIELDNLHWQMVEWEPAYFLTAVGTYWGADDFEPEFDFNTFHQQGGKSRHRTAVALDSGAWDYAPIVLATEQGFISTQGNYVNRPFLLVEGHQRRRYLNALASRGKALKRQRVFVLKQQPSTA